MTTALECAQWQRGCSSEDTGIGAIGDILGEPIKRSLGWATNFLSSLREKMWRRGLFLQFYFYFLNIIFIFEVRMLLILSGGVE